MFVIKELIFAVLIFAATICAVPTAEVREEIEDPVNCVAFKTPVFVTNEEMELPMNCAAVIWLVLKDPVETDAIFALLPI